MKSVIKRFGEVYIPHQQIAIDEGMIPWRGNIHFRVYSPDKPNKYGMKSYMLCDSRNSYCSVFEMYTGKDDSKKASEYGATYDLVMKMVRGLYGKGYHLFLDNYYSSPTLFRHLSDLGINATGTLRANRKGVPDCVKKTPCSTKGDKYVVHSGNLLIMKWHDRKIVHVMSTVHKAQDIVVPGKFNPMTHEHVKRPEIVHEYDKFMGGVDRCDQMLANVTLDRATLKWWKKAAVYVISLAALNAYILYKERHGAHPKSHREFRQGLISQLVESVNPEDLPVKRSNRGGRPSKAASEVPGRLVGRHFPEIIGISASERKLSRSCQVCEPAEKSLQSVNPTHKKRRSGSTTCYQCNVCKVALCVQPCFRHYHECKDYKKAYIQQKENMASNN